jgi:hypothetical protein
MSQEAVIQTIRNINRTWLEGRDAFNSFDRCRDRRRHLSPSHRLGRR